MPVQAVAAYVAEDLRALALAFPDELLFASALQAIGDELGRLARDPNRGVRMQGHYADWHRTAFQSSVPGQGHPADLRIVYRVLLSDHAQLELRVFGHRFLPDVIYLRGRDRRLMGTTEPPR